MFSNLVPLISPLSAGDNASCTKALERQKNLQILDLAVGVAALLVLGGLTLFGSHLNLDFQAIHIALGVAAGLTLLAVMALAIKHLGGKHKRNIAKIALASVAILAISCVALGLIGHFGPSVLSQTQSYLFGAGAALGVFAILKGLAEIRKRFLVQGYSKIQNEDPPEKEGSRFVYEKMPHDKKKH